jgi:hypothetical protein
LREHRHACNPARAFIEANLVLRPGGVLPKMAVYGEYVSYCKERGNDPFNEAIFAKEVFRVHRGHVKSSRPRVPGTDLRENTYVGIAWGDVNETAGGLNGARATEQADEASKHDELGQGGQGGQGISYGIPK